MASSSPPPSTVDFEMSSHAPSTAATSPPPEEVPEKEENTTEYLGNAFITEEDTEKKLKRLKFVLEKSTTYAKLLQTRMEEHKERQRQVSQPAESPRRRKKGKKRVHEDDDSEPSRKRVKGDDGVVLDSVNDAPAFEQPKLVTGATLKNYQLQGVQWMIALDSNGISGILADEMGLGKTLQTIAFNAYLREQRISKHFLIVCPLSVLHNWIEEYNKFAPSIPVCMYHGTPAERAELRKTVMKKPVASGSKAKPSPKKNKTTRRKHKRVEDSEEEDEDSEDEDEEDEDEMDEEQSKMDFPVVVTTYEIIIRDQAHLSKYDWGYIVVDEGHRLKNLDCRLMKEIKKYESAGRMILTGTPLHNNLAELWSLLNFILPDIFNDIDSFQEWFNIPTMQASLGSERSAHLVDALHAILKPFILRRLKSDVEDTLPPKKEYILYAPLTEQQRNTYDHVLEGNLRAHLLSKTVDKTKAEKKKVNVDSPRKTRNKGKRMEEDKYAMLDGDDDDYFDALESGELDHLGKKKKKEQTSAELAEQHHLLQTRKQVNNMKLQNTVMQLRKVCSHPFLFEWPLDSRTLEPVLTEELVNASGKMMVLERLLDELFTRKHKVLLFSQFTTMLDIIEDWAVEFKGWNLCRIDGSTSPIDRRDQMRRFQEGGEKRDAPILFLLSTRAGGLGINLTAADTVIFYDQDWNPQMDAQAQDRCHRIGQTKPVLIFRLVSAHTIETRIMSRATEKRKLEALVIAKGKFKMPSAIAKRDKTTMAEMATALLKLEGEKIDVVPNTKEGKRNVLSEQELDVLLDRSPEVFTDRTKGWTNTGAEGLGKGEGEAAFAVYEAPASEGNDALAKLLGEDVE